MNGKKGSLAEMRAVHTGAGAVSLRSDYKVISKKLFFSHALNNAVTQVYHHHCHRLTDLQLESEGR